MHFCIIQIVIWMHFCIIQWHKSMDWTIRTTQSNTLFEALIEMNCHLKCLIKWKKTINSSKNAVFLVIQINRRKTCKNVISSFWNNQVRYFRKIAKSSNCGQNFVFGKVHFQVTLRSDFRSLIFINGLSVCAQEHQIKN